MKFRFSTEVHASNVSRLFIAQELLFDNKYIRASIEGCDTVVTVPDVSKKRAAENAVNNIVAVYEKMLVIK